MQEHILSILIFFPALAAMLGFVVQKDSVRAYGITVAAIEFFLSLWLWHLYDPMTSGMQFMEMAPLVSAFGINYLVGIDGISLFIIILSTF
ncbi:MAG: NADH-quinone oxidoreductase subunit M, partial [Sulfuricurvum sp.]|nr:NADH-quinone oxidoreductase subunit M [Sulfuricurvum sp.]